MRSRNIIEALPTKLIYRAIRNFMKNAEIQALRSYCYVLCRLHLISQKVALTSLRTSDESYIEE
ncbi:hypothetical protein C0J52_04729 [Blattella germanica]|nr:hypothetical protein C0J52_04729 [Blattella germanica]